MKNAVVAVVVMCAAAGCGPSGYSGDFEVRSEFPEDIQIVNWSNFQWAGPSGGTIAAGTEAGTHFPRLKQFPDSTTVEWYIDGEPDEHFKQTLVLSGVVPKGKEGQATFTLDKDGKWNVTFGPIPWKH